MSSEFENYINEERAYRTMHFPLTCRECGKEEQGTYMLDRMQELAKGQLCFSCNFWMEKIRWAQNGDKTEQGSQVLRIEGKHEVAHAYIEGELPRFGVGYGGALFKWKLFTGEEGKSNNVWHQGTIPEHFRSRLPDNAEWVK